jgi:hypothetical protein
MKAHLIIITRTYLNFVRDYLLLLLHYFYLYVSISRWFLEILIDISLYLGYLPKKWYNFILLGVN